MNIRDRILKSTKSSNISVDYKRVLTDKKYMDLMDENLIKKGRDISWKIDKTKILKQ